MSDWRVTCKYISDKRMALKHATDEHVCPSSEYTAVLMVLMNEIKTWFEKNTRYRLPSIDLDSDGYILQSEVEKVSKLLGAIHYHEMILSDLPSDPDLKNEVRLSEIDLIASGVTIIG